MTRPKVPASPLTGVLVRSRRRCALCFGLNHIAVVVRGQVAHIDRNPANNSSNNLVWLCLNHHDEYDSRTRQSKGLTTAELTSYRDELYAFNERSRVSLDAAPPLRAISPVALAIARYLNEQSEHGFHLDSQVLIDLLPQTLNESAEDIEIAIDELYESGLVEPNGSYDFLLATDRLFWETDPLFRESDPPTDAESVARFIVSFEHDYPDMNDIAIGLNWSPRRLNPAATYLIEAGIVEARRALGCAPFCCLSLIRTPRTKRFVRDMDATNAA